MAIAVAPPKSTGGGGFAFEDKVVAWYLSHMLANEAPLDIGGAIEEIHFQVGADEWLLDDMRLTLAGATQTRAAFSIKSNRQFTDTTAPTDFVQAIWKQFLHDGTRQFDENRDHLGLITAPLEPANRSDVEFVLSTAREGDPKLLPGRYSQDGWASKNRRALFRSFACPEELAKKHAVTESDIGRLLARTRHLAFDFEATPSQDESLAVERCRRALRSGNLENAKKLWSNLLAIAAKKRPSSGSISRAELLQELRGSFSLRELPEHQDDWRTLLSLTRSNLQVVRDVLGDDIKLDRSSEHEKIQEAIDQKPGLILLGPSGSGKTALLKACAEELLGQGTKCLWIDARSLDRTDYAGFEADLRLDHRLAEVLQDIPDAQAVLIVEGVDRLYEDRAFGILSALIHATGVSSGIPWKIIIACQTPEWPRIERALRSKNIRSQDWARIEIDHIEASKLDPVWRALPNAAKLQHQRQLAPVLRNLKILDLIATRATEGSAIDSGDWVGETSIAEWYWEQEIASGPERAQRERFTMKLAQEQADKLQTATPIQDFDIATLTPLDGLERDRICRRVDTRRVAFTHDLLGDWARLHILRDQDEICAFLKDKASSPLWHRAIRLYGIHLLETDPDRWEALRDDLDDGDDDGDGGSDLLLEGILFSPNAATLIDDAWQRLIKDDGKDLRRLLKRFLAFGTRANETYLVIARAQGLDEHSIAATCRMPNWMYWPPVLKVLHKNLDDTVRSAPGETARIVELWLDHTPRGTRYRREATTIGLGLGKLARQAHKNFDLKFKLTHDDQVDLKALYKAALLGAEELPDDVAAFALAASERQQEETAEKSETEDTDFFGTPIGPHPEPWPDAPLRHISEDFREVILDSPALSPLMRARPAAAREVILANSIRQRTREPLRSRHSITRRELDIHNSLSWSPVVYVNGPFLFFLQQNFDEALETIIRLVEFATQRWEELADAKARWRKAENIRRNGNFEEAALGEIPSSHRSRKLNLEVDGVLRTYIGGQDVYGWSSGLGNPPQLILAALMALEKHLYMEIDEGRDVSEKIEAVLKRTSSTALLKLLCDLGKYKPELFQGPLRPFLGSPAVYEWDIATSGRGRYHMTFLKGLARVRAYAELAEEFHAMPHRDQDLRDIAGLQFFNNETMCEYLTQVGQEWERQLDAGAYEGNEHFLRALAARFNIAHYEVREHPVHGAVVVNRRNEELVAERAPELEELQFRRTLFGMPMRCRRILDESEPLSEEALEELIDNLELLEERLPTIRGPWGEASESEDEDGDLEGSQPLSNEAASALAGVAAVLLRHHRECLEAHPKRREWCLNLLASLCTRPPPPAQFDMPDNVSSETWDCFAAEVIPDLLAEDPTSENLRALTALLAFARHYNAITILFKRAANHRVKLGEDFHKLRRIAFEYARMRERARYLSPGYYWSESIDDEVRNAGFKRLDQWQRKRVEGFIAGTLPTAVDDWYAMDQPEGFEGIDEDLAKRFRGGVFDFQLLSAAHGWLPLPNNAIDEEERALVVDLLHRALEYVVGCTPQGGDYSGLPSGDARWVLIQAGRMLPQLSEAEHPQHFWQRIISELDESHHWAHELFFNLHRYGLQENGTTPGFPDLRETLLEEILSPESSPGWRAHEDVWRALIGIDQIMTKQWNEHHTQLARRSLPHLRLWLEKVGRDSRQRRAFARWLTNPAASSIRLSLLPDLKRAIESNPARRPDDQRAEGDAITALLQLLWEEHEPGLREHCEAMGAFQGILQRLTAQQHPQALHLQGQLGRLEA